MSIFAKNVCVGDYVHLYKNEHVSLCVCVGGGGGNIIHPLDQ